MVIALVFFVLLSPCRANWTWGQTTGLSNNARNVLQNYAGLSLDSLRYLFQDSNHSSIRIIEGRRRGHICVLRNHNFLFSPYFGSIDNSLIISQTTEWVEGPWEGNDPWLEARGLVVDSSGTKRVWSISEAADEGELWGSFYRTTLYGCCAALTVYRLHSLSDGRLVTAHNDSLLSLWRTKNYIGVLEAPYFEYMSQKTEKGAIALISYVSEDSCLHQVLFRTTDDSTAMAKLECDSDEIANPEGIVTLIEADSALTHCDQRPLTWHLTSSRQHALESTSPQMLRVSFMCDSAVFVIPFKDDDFLIENTKFGQFEIVVIK